MRGWDTPAIAVDTVPGNCDLWRKIMDTKEVFGVNWNCETMQERGLYINSLTTVIKYTNSRSDICYITHDVINLLQWPDGLNWVIDNEKILLSIHEASIRNAPLFICFNDDEKKAVEKMIYNSSLKEVCVISTNELFV
jgi:hypothetical protein